MFENPILRHIIERTWAALPDRFPTIDLDVMVVMPNHLHFVIHLTDRAGTNGAPALGDIVRVLKSVAAVDWLKHIRKHALEDSAQIWQRNYYEHIIRNEPELRRIREYVANNPMNWRYDLDNPDRHQSAEYEKAWSWLERSGRA